MVYYYGLVGILLLVIISLYGYSVFNWKSFNKNLQHIRGGWYIILLFSLGGYVYWFQSVTEWKNVMAIVAVFVFVDLAIFIRPRIKKIWGAELEMNEVLDAAETMNEQITSAERKSEIFTSIVSVVDKDEFFSLTWASDQDYIDNLKEFLISYTDQCMQDITVLSYVDRNGFSSKMKVLGYPIEDRELDELDVGNVVPIGDSKALISVSKKSPIIIFVRQKDGWLQVIDYSHIQNLATIHSFYEAKEVV